VQAADDRNVNVIQAAKQLCDITSTEQSNSIKMQQTGKLTNIPDAINYKILLIVSLDDHCWVKLCYNTNRLTCVHVTQN